MTLTLSANRTVDAARRQELAAFLRSRRDRLAPESVGLISVGRRRAPGLRREEVAQLAGVGVTWYTWLEQGRSINVSAQVLGAIARALQLDGSENGHLFTLAGLPDPAGEPEDALAAGSMEAILNGLDPLPAYSVSARYDVLAWNRAGAAVLGDFGALPPERRNILWLLFTQPAWKELIHRYETETGINCVARFRRYFAAHVGDPAWQHLVDELSERSPEFRRLWARHDVSASTPKVKRFNHPVAGELWLAASTLWLADQPGDRLVVYTPVDAHGQEMIHRLSEGGPWAPWTD